jgi:thioredoxin-dependent peroxiredoxin
MLAENEKAPEFELQNQDGETIRLANLRGKKVILYFYPKDDTPGCTAQACDIRDHYDEFKKRGALIFGVSPDSVKSHKKFEEKYGLPFPLLADEGHTVAEKYGVWGEKTMYGKKYFGVERSTFVIDEQGRIAKIFPKVKPSEHVDQVLAVL